MCAFLLPCALQPITFNLSLCGVPAVPTVPPFSCRCTLMTGGLWPLLCRQCCFLADISRHSSAVLRQWRLHSVIYSTWTPNTTSCHFALLQFLKMHKYVHFLSLTRQDFLNLCQRDERDSQWTVTMWLMFTGNGFLMLGKWSGSLCFFHWLIGRWDGSFYKTDAICVSHKCVKNN